MHAEKLSVCAVDVVRLHACLQSVICVASLLPCCMCSFAVFAISRLCTCSFAQQCVVQTISNSAWFCLSCLSSKYSFFMVNFCIKLQVTGQKIIIYCEVQI